MGVRTGPSTVYRRFREFHALRASLVHSFGKDRIKGRFEVPKKKALGKLAAAVVLRRTTILQSFLDDVRDDSAIGMHQLIQDFFKIREGEHGGGAAGGGDKAGLPRKMSRAVSPDGYDTNFRCVAQKRKWIATR
jgi:hypothetical protein